MPGRVPHRQLYPIVYLDALVIKIREGHRVRNRAAHIAVGVDFDGIRHVLGIWATANEGAKFWHGYSPSCASKAAATRCSSAATG